VESVVNKAAYVVRLTAAPSQMSHADTPLMVWGGALAPANGIMDPVGNASSAFTAAAVRT
jgi:hypothetical protein